MTRRIVFSYSFIMLFLVIAAFGTASAAFGNSTYTEAVGRQSTYTLHVASSRGTIYDRNMQPLTNASEKYVAAVTPSIESLSRLNTITDENQRDELRRALESGKPFLIEVNSPISTDGIVTFTIDKRYSDKQPAANLIGYLENGTTGISGIERSYNDLLTQNQGDIDVTFTVDAVGQVISGASLQVENTYQINNSGIVLTLDRSIQTEVETACSAIDKGAAVVLDCQTGQILAMASLPALEPNNLADSLEDPDAPFLNRALCAYAPGSVFKLVSAAAALEQGADYRETYTCTGSIVVDNLEFACYDHIAHGEVNMHTALRQSCNGYFVQLVQKTGAECVLQMAKEFGIGSEIKMAEGLFSDAGYLSDIMTLQNPRACANFSFGQGETTVTPLQIAAIINAIAAGGEYIEPQLFWGTVNNELEVEGIPAFESRKVMELTTSNRLRAYMESTARYGTARIGAPQNCISGIKTGTAETGVYDENGNEIFNYWYAGYICDDDENPIYTIVVLEESSEETHVPDAFRKIAETLIDFI